MTPLDVIKLLLAITGLNFKFIIETIWPSIMIPAQVGILISTMILLLVIFVLKWKSENKKQHIFDECSLEEANFFDEWYRKEGDIIIFCTHLNWLENEHYLRVVDAFKKKGDKLDLYLKKTESRVVDELLLSGAKLHRVRENIRSEHRFSIRKNNGFRSIIIRNDCASLFL